MPQISIEYTANLKNSEKLLALGDPIHTLLVDNLPADRASCRTQFSCLDKFYITDGQSDQAFVHVKVRIMAGRTAEVLNHTGQLLLALIKKEIPSEQDVILSMEIKMLSPHYFK